MKLEILLPAIGISLVVSYLIVYRVLEVDNATVRWLSTLCLTVMLTFLYIKAFVGEIRPFYAAFAIMVGYLLVQRRLRASQPDSQLTETVSVE